MASYDGSPLIGGASLCILRSTEAVASPPVLLACGYDDRIIRVLPYERARTPVRLRFAVGGALRRGSPPMLRLNHIARLTWQRVAIRAVLAAVSASGAAARADEPVSRDLLESIAPAVVCIAVESEGSATWLGSGLVISKDGVVLTDVHVLDSPGPVKVMLHSGTIVGARVAGKDTISGVAILKIDAGSAPYLSIDHAGTTSIGDPVFSVSGCAAVGESHLSTMTGAVTLIGPEGKGQKLIQASQARFPPEMAGSPLVSARSGQVIGINLEVLGTPALPRQATLSLPLGDALVAARSLREHGRHETTAIGIAAANLDDRGAAELRLPVPHAPIITALRSGGPAARAGLQVGDVPIQVDGNAVTSVEELFAVIRQTPAGANVELTLWRNAEAVHIKVTPERMSGH